MRFRFRSFFAKWLRLRATPETRRQCFGLFREMARQGIVFSVDDTPLVRVPLDQLTEGQALQLIADCRLKMLTHTRVELLRGRAEKVRARGLGVLVE